MKEQIVKQIDRFEFEVKCFYDNDLNYIFFQDELHNRLSRIDNRKHTFFYGDQDSILIDEKSFRSLEKDNLEHFKLVYDAFVGDYDGDKEDNELSYEVSITYIEYLTAIDRWDLVERRCIKGYSQGDYAYIILENDESNVDDTLKFLHNLFFDAPVSISIKVTDRKTDEEDYFYITDYITYNEYDYNKDEIIKSFEKVVDSQMERELLDYLKKILPATAYDIKYD